MASKHNGTIRWLDANWKMIRSKLRSPFELEFDDRVVFSLTSDHHFGHADCDEQLIRKFFTDIIDAGVITHFIVGDVVESAYNLRVSEELGEAIVQEQIEGWKRILPEAENNRYYLLLGNHDLHAAALLIGKENGSIGYKDAADVFREVLADRRDIEVVDACFARVELNNRYLLDLIHPKGNNGSCLTRYADHYISNAAKKGFDPPQLVDFGHYHNKKMMRSSYCPVMQNGSAIKKKNNEGNGFGWVVEFGKGLNGKDMMIIYECL